MYLSDKWNKIMGPKDERLEYEENKAIKTSAYILLIGSILSLYYAIMLNQVAETTDHPILTTLGDSVVPVQIPLIITILVAGMVSIYMQIRAGNISPHKRYAEVDSIPWDYVCIMALIAGAFLGILTCGMRIVAEIQIVGIDGVAWFGDIAIGIVFFIMGFVIGFVCIAIAINSAIKRRHEIESEIEG